MMLFGLEKLDKSTPDFLCFHEGVAAIKNAKWADLGPFCWGTKLIELVVLCA
jgi:hypothetical protein